MLTFTRRLLELALATFVVSVLGLALAAQLAPAGGYGLYAVRSGSMAPAIGVGDLVIEQRVDPAAIGAGDVITIETGTGATVTHRVATVTTNDAGPVFTTKGDANPSPDPVASRGGQVRGRVALDLPLLGYVLAMVTTLSGGVALVSIGGVLLVGIWLLDELVTKEEDDELEQLAHELDAARAGTA